MDVTANASAIYFALIGKEPYGLTQVDDHYFADLKNLDFSELKRAKGLSKGQKRSLERLLRQALNPDYSKRPTAKEFAKTMAKIFPNQAGQLLASA